MNKYIFFLFLCILISPLSAQKKKITKKKSAKSSLITVEGTITQTFSYCGGAPPPEEFLKELATPKPYIEYTLYFKKESNDFKSPIIKEVKTDSNGRFMLTLPPGKYVMVDSRKKDLATYNQVLNKYSKETQNNLAIDKKCLTDFFATPDYTIIVPANSKKTIVFTYNYYKDCNWSGHPCVEYRGPYPP